jgi:APA family basic amino acid/polyamine antiporter
LVRRVSLTRKLSTFDVTSLVVGSIIGADIYVAAAIGVKYVGPASLLVWVLAGIMATVIAVSFAYCATMVPEVGGPYSYVKDVAGPFGGFIVGWSLLLAEWLSLAVFPVAFARYFVALAGSLGLPMLTDLQQILVKIAFIGIILVTNVFGVKAAGRFNDGLTIGKLAPLFLLMIGGLLFITLNLGTALPHFEPFFQGDIFNLGQALVLIFWAYAGFELSTLPANDIERPARTIPRAIFVGMVIVAVFYLTTNFVILGLIDPGTLSASTAPLMDAAAVAFSLTPTTAFVGALVLGVGAVVSIMGSDESSTIGTSRLAFAMAADGLLPRFFGKLHRKYQTPYIGLIVLCVTALVASLLGTLSQLINASVFLLAFAYIATCVSTVLLERRHKDTAEKFRARRIIPALGVVCGLVLLSQVGLDQMLISLVMLGIGVPVYVFFSPKQEVRELKGAFVSREAYLKRAFEQGEVFLGYLVRRIRWAVYRARKKKKPWQTYD